MLLMILLLVGVNGCIAHARVAATKDWREPAAVQTTVELNVEI